MPEIKESMQLDFLDSREEEALKDLRSQSGISLEQKIEIYNNDYSLRNGRELNSNELERVSAFLREEEFVT